MSVDGPGELAKLTVSALMERYLFSGQKRQAQLCASHTILAALSSAYRLGIRSSWCPRKSVQRFHHSKNRGAANNPGMWKSRATGRRNRLRHPSTSMLTIQQKDSHERTVTITSQAGGRILATDAA